MASKELPKDHNHTQCIETALVKATKICTNKGLRLTFLRKRVLELVWQSHKPIGAYTLVAQMSQNGKHVAPPTVYRALEFLLNLGLVHRLTSLNAFVGCPNPGHSIYCQFLICNECSNVIELQDSSVIKSILSCTDSNEFKIQGEIVEIKGVCKDCQHSDTK